MASPKSDILGAFKRLRDSITVEDAHQFESTSLKDFWVAVREIESSQRRQCNQNIRRVEPMLRGMEKLGTAIDVLCNGTPFLPVCLGWCLSPPLFTPLAIFCLTCKLFRLRSNSCSRYSNKSRGFGYRS